jgi:hypothetical protein
VTGRAGFGQCPSCGQQARIRAGGTLAPHQPPGGAGTCPGSGGQPAQPVPCTGCGRTGLALYHGGRCSVCRDRAGAPRRDADEAAKPVLLLARLAGQPATAYYVCGLALAERLAADAEGSGDTVQIRSVKDFAAAQAVAADVKPGELRLLGVQADSGRWVQPPATARAAQRN